jgi:hypothetical protein
MTLAWQNATQAPTGGARRARRPAGLPDRRARRAGDNVADRIDTPRRARGFGDRRPHRV